MTIGQRIKKRRTEMGLSQAKLADAVGVDRSLISQLESDKGTGTSHVAALAYALKVNALWLQTGKGQPDVDYTPPIEISKNYYPEIEDVIELMSSSDDRGRAKALIAVQDALDAHHAWKTLNHIDTVNSVPRAQEGNEIAKNSRRLAQKLLPEIIDREKMSTNDVGRAELNALARKDKRH